MNKKEAIEKIRLYKIDLEFCKEAGYKTIAIELKDKIKALNLFISQQSKENPC